MSRLQLSSIPALNERTNEACELLTLGLPKEKTLNSERPTKVLTIDSLLKSTFALLQIIVVALQGWMMTKILEHGDRLTKAEVASIYQATKDHEVLQALRDILLKQTNVLENQAVMKNDVDRLKADLKDKFK